MYTEKSLNYNKRTCGGTGSGEGLSIFICSLWNQQGHSPWYSPGLQHVGDAHVPGPDVKLPFL